MELALLGGLVAAGALGVWLLGRVGDPRTPTTAEVQVAAELRRLGFQQVIGDAFVSRTRPGLQVMLGPKRSTILARTEHAPYGEFPVEDDAEFSPDGILVHFPTEGAAVEEALERTARLLTELAEAGAWKAAAVAHGLRFRRASGLRQIHGVTQDGLDVSVRQDEASAEVWVPLTTSAWARAGRGSSGNPVLDMLIDSHGVPEEQVEAVLDLVHGRGGQVGEGRIQVRWQGDMRRCLDTVLGLARALRETPQSVSASERTREK